MRFSLVHTPILPLHVDDLPPIRRCCHGALHSQVRRRSRVARTRTSALCDECLDPDQAGLFQTHGVCRLMPTTHKHRWRCPVEQYGTLESV